MCIRDRVNYTAGDSSNGKIDTDEAIYYNYTSNSGVDEYKRQSKNTVSKSPKIDSIICLTPYLYFSFIDIIIFILILNIKYDYIDF